MSDRIDAHPASGFRDYLPPDARARQMMIDRTRAVFERFGFSPIDTPALERLDVLTGGDPEFKKYIYQARITPEDEPLGLRFDLTVPLARFVAAHAGVLQMPFSRYHIGNVWRGEHAQAGRYREFVQCDADIIGTKSMTADAQVIAMAHTVYAELGVADSIRIRISNRKIIDGLAGFLEFDASHTPGVLRAIDKLDKLNWPAVAAELRDKVGLEDSQVDAIRAFLDLKGDTPEELLTAVHTMLQFGEVSHPGIEELRELVSHLDAFGVPRAAWEIDLSLARGLGYYSGTVFEVMLANAPQYGSVGSGGRYDDLVKRFAPMELPGVGMSVGMDRLFAALDELALIPATSPSSQLAVLDFEPSARAKVLALAGSLRASNVPTTLYVGAEATLKGQLSWAVKAGFPFVAIMGEREMEKGVVQLKDMNARTQDEVSVADLAKRLAEAASE